MRKCIHSLEVWHKTVSAGPQSELMIACSSFSLEDGQSCAGAVFDKAACQTRGHVQYVV